MSLDINTLKQMRQAITPGEWRYDRICDAVLGVEGDKTNVVVADVFDLDLGQFIAQAPAILDLAISLLEGREGLREKIDGMKKKTSHQTSICTWFQDGYCMAHKKHLTQQELIDDFGYNEAISDVLAILDNQKL